MNEQEICPQEPMILATRAEGRRNHVSAQHLLACASCREADALAAGMRQLIAVNIDKRPPAADVVWMMAQLSKPIRTRWTVETWKGLAGLVTSALLTSMAWPAIQGYLSSIVPIQMMTIVPMLASALVATSLAVIAFRTHGF